MYYWHIRSIYFEDMAFFLLETYNYESRSSLVWNCSFFWVCKAVLLSFVLGYFYRYWRERIGQKAVVFILLLFVLIWIDSLEAAHFIDLQLAVILLTFVRSDHFLLRKCDIRCLNYYLFLSRPCIFVRLFEQFVPQFMLFFDQL